jgi:hypothetical protein
MGMASDNEIMRESVLELTYVRRKVKFHGTT